MNKQCLDIEQMRHLKDLGVDTSKAMMCYRRRRRDSRGEEKVGRWSLVINQPIIVSNFETYEDIPTFTLQDILDLLPSTIDINNSDEINEYWLEFGVSERDKSYWFVQYRSIDDNIHTIREESYLIDAAYEMLCWFIENGYIKTNKED